MELENKLRKRMMLEALDYIDDDIISSTVKKITPNDCRTDDPVITWRTPLKHWKRYLALVACLLLLSVASPLVSYIAVVIRNFNPGAGSESTEAISSEFIETESPFTPDTTQFIPDTTQERADEPLDVSQFILDWEKSMEDYLDQKRQEHPDKLYFNESDDEAFVVCYYTLKERNTADSIIAKHNMKILFPHAVINPLSSIKMIMLKFAMDDFTQGLYDKMEEIKNSEPMIEKLSVGVEGGFRLAYIPNIEYYSKDAAATEFTVLSPLLTTRDSADLIIRSKEEYDRYIDLMKSSYNTDYYSELLEKQSALYDEAFFAENALIITRIITRGSGSIKLSVNNVYTSGDKAYVVVKTLEPGGGGTCDMQYKSFSISVKQSDVVNIKELITLD